MNIFGLGFFLYGLGFLEFRNDFVKFTFHIKQRAWEIILSILSERCVFY